MTVLPIMDRELRVAARLTSTFKKRALTAAVVALVAMVMLLFGGFSSVPADVGTAMFDTLSYMTLVFCLLEGVRKTADCLSEERREGTLGLLFLTDLKGYDVILGKLAATALPSLYGLLAMLPILGLSLLLGGVTQGEFWRRSLALINILFFSLAAGMWASSRSRRERNSVLATMWVIFLVMALPFLGGAHFISRFSPGYGFFHATDASYRTSSDAYWHSLALTQALSWLLVTWAAFTVSRVPQDEAVMDGQPRWRRNFVGARIPAQLRAKLLDVNPALWLAGRNAGGRLSLWVLSAVVGLACLLILPTMGSGFFGVLIPTFFFANFLVKIRLAAQSCRCLAEARRNNALEMLLCTPLKVDEMLRGQLLALKRTFLAPVILLVSVEIMGWFGGIALFSDSNSREMILAAGFSIVGAAVFLAVFILDMLAVIWVGMWYGLSSRNETQAAFKTVLMVLVLPSFLMIFSLFAIPYFIAWPIIAIILAREKLRSQFRMLAGQRYAPQKDSSGWWPFQKPARPPPSAHTAPPLPVPPPTPVDSAADGSG